MARPSFATRAINPQAVQTAAGVGLEGMHDFLWTNIRFDNGVDVICPHMCGPKIPAIVQANVAESIEDNRPAPGV